METFYWSSCLPLFSPFSLSPPHFSFFSFIFQSLGGGSPPPLNRPLGRGVVKQKIVEMNPYAFWDSIFFITSEQEYIHLLIYFLEHWDWGEELQIEILSNGIWYIHIYIYSWVKWLYHKSFYKWNLFIYFHNIIIVGIRKNKL